MLIPVPSYTEAVPAGVNMHKFQESGGLVVPPLVLATKIKILIFQNYEII